MKKLIPIVLLFSALTAGAQNYADTSYLRQRFERTEKILNILHEFRIIVYIQPQWQRADTAGISSVQGGNFPAAANNRLMIRRGRFRLQWTHETVTKFGDTTAVGKFDFQYDATEKGFNAFKDLYGRIIDPWTGWFSILAGIHERQFGWETPASPMVYESPEFSRVNQTILPNECELGEFFIVESPRTFKPLYLRFDANVMNGEGIGNAGVGQSSNATGAYQSAKDYSFRLMLGKTINITPTTRFRIMASGSYYYGNVLQGTKNVYEVVRNVETGLDTFKNVTTGHADTAGLGKTDYHRQYEDAHLQVDFDYKMTSRATATTTLRGEMMTGTQPGQLTSSSVPLGAGTAAPAVDLYIRKFLGYMVLFNQGFHYKCGGQTMHNDITFKVDYYNPNTQAGAGTNITKGAGFTTTDMSWTTFSFGTSFTPVPYCKLMLWYDYVTNEATSIPGWEANYPKSGVFTLRTQFMIDTWWFDKKPTTNENYISKGY